VFAVCSSVTNFLKPFSSTIIAGSIIGESG
jgi:hypothetical protein